MIGIFDILSLTLLAGALCIFFLRYFREEPPILPYFVIACTCATSNWLDEAGMNLAATVLLTAAAFLFLGCLIFPKVRKMGQSEDGEAETGSRA